MTAYQFLYTDCIYESAYATMSTHLTIKGAYRAMKKFLEKGYAEWREDGIMYGKQRFKFGEHEAWTIKKIEIID